MSNRWVRLYRRSSSLSFRFGPFMVCSIFFIHEQKQKGNNATIQSVQRNIAEMLVVRLDSLTPFTKWLQWARVLHSFSNRVCVGELLIRWLRIQRSVKERIGSSFKRNRTFSLADWIVLIQSGWVVLSLNSLTLFHHWATPLVCHCLFIFSFLSFFFNGPVLF